MLPVGRVVLVKSVITSILIYHMTVSHLPNRSINKLNSLIRKFIWGKLHKQKYLAMLSLDQMCKPFEEGGIGI
jgi:hypothetical protein